MAAARLVTVLLAAALLLPAAASPAAPAREPRCRLREQPPKRTPRSTCTSLVHEYKAQHTADFEAPSNVSRLLFFLHVPRTAGKTYANCFLRSAIPPSRRCAKSYDVLRLNVSLPGCQALVSHDDFSISQFFPPGAATITQLRRPVERLISSYEFAVDVAAKGVLHLARPRKNPKRRFDFVGTLEVWPWSILVPWFKQDMAQRLEKLRLASLHDPTAWRAYTSPQNRTYYWNEARNESVWVLPDAAPVLDPYNNSLVMPLAEFVEHPIAAELLHNGATLQVLGLTNYSYWPGAAPLRACLAANGVAREMMLGLARRRLAAMAHVGLTERLEESVQSMAADLGLDLEGPAYKYTSSSAFSYDAGALDYEELLTFTAVTEGDANLTVTRREAGLRVGRVVEAQRDVQRQIDELKPRLDELVDQESRWLEEQDAVRAAEEDAAAAEELDRQQTEGGEEESDALGQDACEEACGADGAASCSEEGSGKEQTERGMASRNQDGSEADGSLQAAAQEAEGAAAADWEDGGSRGTGDAGAAAVAADYEQHSAQGEDAAAAAEEEEEEELLDDVDSPWAEEIKALDGQLAVLQERMRQLEAELASLQNSGLIVSADEATGPARQLIDDQHFLQPGSTLGQAYARCASAGRGRRERRQVYKHLRTPWGETFRFGPQSRARIPVELRARIHQLNALDEELWRAGRALLEAKLEAQRSAGLLQQLQPVHPRPHERVNGTGAARRRKLSSVGDTAGGQDPATPDVGAGLYAVDAGAADAAPDAAHKAAAAARQGATVEDEGAAASQHAASPDAQQAFAAGAGVVAGDSDDGAMLAVTPNDTASSPPSDGAPGDTVVNASSQTQHDEL